MKAQKLQTTVTLANHLRRRFFIGLLITSAGMVVFVAGTLLFCFQANQAYEDRLVEASLTQNQIVIITAALFWVLVGGWLAVRLPASMLHDLDHLEYRVLDAAQARGIRLTPGPGSSAIQHQGSLFPACGLLIERLADGGAKRVKFLEIVSHEMRSPLATILGFGTIMADPSLQLAEADARHYAQIIARQARVIDRLIENMLTVARIEEGQLEMARTPLCLRDLAVEVIEEARLQSQREIILEDGLGEAIWWGDALRMREVLLNVIENALKYSAANAPVHVTLRQVEEESWAEITVVDKGIGIAKDDMPILFNRFGRIRNEQTRGIFGNGLGLYIVNHIVQRHGGSVAVYSQPGQGTDFTVRLPMH